MGTVPNPKSNWVAGTVPTANEFNSNIRDAINFFLSPPRVQVTHSATITRPSPASWSLIPWNTEAADADSTHDPVTANSQLVAKTPGLYHVWANITWEDHAASFYDGDRGVQIRKNSGGSNSLGTLIGIDHRHCNTLQLVGSSGASFQGCDGFVWMNGSTDYVECFAFDDDNDSGGVGCSLKPNRWAAQRFGMVWIAQ